MYTQYRRLLYCPICRKIRGTYTKLRTPSDKTEGKRSTADNIRRSTKTHVALSSKILERCAEIYLYKQYIFVSMVCL